MSWVLLNEERELMNHQEHWVPMTLSLPFTPSVVDKDTCHQLKKELAGIEPCHVKDGTWTCKKTP